MKNLPLHTQVFIAIVLAIAAGLISGADNSIFGILWVDIYGFVGTLFLNALKMIVVPLVTASIICGVAGLVGDNIGRLGGRTLIYYGVSGLLAVLLGLVVVNLIAPGILDGAPAGERLKLNVDSEEIQAFASKVSGKGSGDIIEVFLRMVPPNIIAAAAQGQMLGLITFSLLFGYFMTRIKKEYSEPLRNFWQAVLDTMMLLTTWILKFTPYGVFGLVAKTIATTGFDAFQPVLLFFVAVALSLLLHLAVTLSIMLKAAGISPWRYVRAMAPVLLTSFSISSSSATLPVTLRTVQSVGVSTQTSSFVLPLGATVNMNGSALYECVAAMFIAQAYGLDLTFGTQFLIVWIALLTSIGVAGVPAASLVAISVILAAIGLPLEGIALLMITDRILDMMRTAVNVYSDACGAAIIAKLNGEKLKL